jgi:hypothetical protein
MGRVDAALARATEILNIDQASEAVSDEQLVLAVALFSEAARSSSRGSSSVAAVSLDAVSRRLRRKGREHIDLTGDDGGWPQRVSTMKNKEWNQARLRAVDHVDRAREHAACNGEKATWAASEFSPVVHPDDVKRFREQQHGNKADDPDHIGYAFLGVGSFFGILLGIPALIGLVKLIPAYGMQPYDGALLVLALLAGFPVSAVVVGGKALLAHAHGTRSRACRVYGAGELAKLGSEFPQLGALIHAAQRAARRIQDSSALGQGVLPITAGDVDTAMWDLVDQVFNPEALDQRRALAEAVDSERLAAMVATHAAELAVADTRLRDQVTHLEAIAEDAESQSALLADLDLAERFTGGAGGSVRAQISAGGAAASVEDVAGRVRAARVFLEEHLTQIQGLTPLADTTPPPTGGTLGTAKSANEGRDEPG